MDTVGVRELKNKLSHYLRNVKKGKPIAITERGKSIAVLMPVDSRPDLQLARELSAKGIGSWKGLMFLMPWLKPPGSLRKGTRREGLNIPS